MRVRTIIILLALLALMLTACSSGQQATQEGALQVGDPAPAFSLPTASGETVLLSDYAGQQPVLLYFHMAVG